MTTNKQNIPRNWSMKKLGEIFKLSAGGDVDKSLFSERQDADHLYPIFANALTNQGLYGYSSDYRVEEESITITGRGDIGKVFYREGKYTPIVRLIVGIPKKDISAKYMSYACSCVHFFNETTGVPQLTVPQVSWYKIAVPPIEEQKKIAEILGTWDRAIEELTGLIAEKKELKRGLMQRLLTGTQRLPGFTKPWNQKKILEFIHVGKIIIEKGKTLTAEQLNTGDIPVIAGGKTVPYYHDKYTHDIPCVTVSASGAYAGYVWWHNSKIWASDCNVLYGVNFDTRFLGFCLENMQKQIYRMQTGGAQPHVYADSIKTLKIPDVDLAEQKAIADVLSKADLEIDLLNQQLDVLREQKRGLMQKLLTGEIRVKVDTDEQ